MNTLGMVAIMYVVIEQIILGKSTLWMNSNMFKLQNLLHIRTFITPDIIAQNDIVMMNSQ